MFFRGNLFAIDITLLLSVLLVGILIVVVFKNVFFKNQLYIPRFSRAILFTVLIFYLWMITTLLYTLSLHYCWIKVFLFVTDLLALAFPFLYPSFNPRRFAQLFAYLGSVLVFGYSILLPGVYDLYLRAAVDREFVVKYLDVGYIAGIVILLVLFACPRMPRLIKILLAGFNAWVILISAARGPLVFLLIVLAIRLMISVFQAIRKSHLFKTWSVKNLFYIGTGLTILAAATYTMLDRYSTLLERSFSRLAQVTDPASASVAERVAMISFSFDKIFENASNFLFGLGIGSFGIVYDNLDGRLYPHNVLLEIGFEMGVIGVLIFLFLILLYGYKLRHNLNALLILGYLLLNNLKSYSLIDQRIMFGVISVLVLMEFRNKDKEPCLRRPETLL